jgi:hypothetical protein
MRRICGLGLAIVLGSMAWLPVSSLGDTSAAPIEGPILIPAGPPPRPAWLSSERPAPCGHDIYDRLAAMLSSQQR